MGHIRTFFKLFFVLGNYAVSITLSTGELLFPATYQFCYKINNQCIMF